MSVSIWTTVRDDELNRRPAVRRSVARRLVYGPALILALAMGSSGALAAALLLSSILEY